MAVYPTYSLRFRSPLHIGERGVGLEVSRPYVPADTLFSAICSAWRDLYGVADLEDSLLAAFNNGSDAPFLLTSAFPYAGDARFFPRPLVNLQVADGRSLRRVQFVSATIFSQIINGETPRFDSVLCINGGTVWVSEEEKTSLAKWIDDASGNISLWKHTVVPRVTLDRVTSASTIWHFGSDGFAEGCGLWFAVKFNNGWRSKFEGALRLLGDSGLGGERGAGHGLFTFDPPRDQLRPDASQTTHFVTLAPCCPKDEVEAAALTADESVAYELMPRRGWVTSPEAGNLRRKMVWMFAEGSVLSGSKNAGRLVPVTPDPSPHDVWRYGYAFPIGVKIR